MHQPSDAIYQIFQSYLRKSRTDALTRIGYVEDVVRPSIAKSSRGVSHQVYSTFHLHKRILVRVGIFRVPKLP